MLEAELRGLSDEVAGTVRVATVYSVGLHALPPRLKPFLAAHPRVNVHLEYRQTSDIYQEVAAGTIDVGIVACPSPRRDIEVLPSPRKTWRSSAPPNTPSPASRRCRLRDLDGLPFIGFADDIPTRKLVDDRLRAAGVRVRLVTSFDNIETIKNLVEIGSGVSILPADTVRQEVAAASSPPSPSSPPTPSAVPRACWSKRPRPAGRRCGRSWRRCGQNGRGRTLGPECALANTGKRKAAQIKSMATASARTRNPSPTLQYQTRP